MSETTYAFYRHATSGDLFAVAVNERGTVVASLGPLHSRDLSRDPGDFAHNMGPEDNDWFYAPDEFVLVEPKREEVTS